MTKVAEYSKLMVDLWEAIGERYKKIHDKEPTIMAHCIMFERADHHFISDQIGEQKGQGRTAQLKDTDKEGHCNDCGRKLTDKEQWFIEKNNTEEICYHCSQKKS